MSDIKKRSENKRVFVGNVPYSLSKAELQLHMERAGEVIRVDLFLDEMKYSRGCGIVEYCTYSDAQRAVSILNHSVLMGRTITVKEDDTYGSSRNRRSPSPKPQPCQIRIKNMPPSVTWQQLKDVCREIGNVTRADLSLDRNGKSKGSGIVTFEKPEEAKEALRLLNGAIFNDREVFVYLDSGDIYN
ncbi:unnamed protein product [Blepharisma stoltei]|uniref:RRM domain-containing protein n=1 Tax=Blepharisma stoltei TaxID=1481888 RepID=A0AAU9JLM5_9CILI|nr:unnamed protein product [Blepharisma stoltei]